MVREVGIFVCTVAICYFYGDILFLYLCKQMKASSTWIIQLLIRGFTDKEFTLFVFSPCQYESLTMASREEAQTLRVQLEEQRERARKEMQEAQRHGNDAQGELEKSHINLRRLEEEVCVCVGSVCVQCSLACLAGSFLL